VIPWRCDDEGCEQQWHVTYYWIDGEGFVVDRYCDGDQEPCDESDLPSADEERKAWLAYARDVAETGADVLGHYNVRRVTKVNERWEFRWSPSIIGPILIEVRHAGRKYQPTKLPDHARNFFSIASDTIRAQITDFRGDNDGLRKLYKPWVWNVTHIRRQIPRNPETVARELKRAARRHLRLDPEQKQRDR